MTDVKVMTFNILSDAPIWKKKWSHMKKEYWIYWEYRKTLIYQIIRQNNPDLACLTECQYDQITFFNQMLAGDYNYIYTSGEPKKTEETLRKYDNYTHDMNPGLLIIFKKNKLRLINNTALDYSHKFQSIGRKKNWKDKQINHLIRPCVSNIILFEDIDSQKRFYFVGLHHWNDPMYNDVKYYQMYVLMKHLNGMNRSYKYPVIMGGDFNATPESAVIGLIQNNKLDMKKLNKEESKNIDRIKLPGKIKNPIKRMISTYEKFTGKDPTYTTYTEHFKNCIDYIFVSDDIQVKSVNDVDKKIQKMINENKFMPNNEFPSDHVDLVVDLVI